MAYEQAPTSPPHSFTSSTSRPHLLKPDFAGALPAGEDFQPIPGLADRLFGSGGGALEHRRPRYPGSGGGQDPPAKCPRCESANTKFCYYNNYNLSQPRHFCKSCRRYWTKGGVLRNVPVGGGCRKSSSSKRSSSSKKSSKDRRKTAASSRSSSDSSTLTATEIAPVSDPVFTGNDGSEFEPVPESDIFPESGTFTSLMMTGPPCVSFSDPVLPSVVEDARMQTMPTDLGGGMEWPSAMDQSIFDLAGVDPGAYWSHGHWGDTDPNLYIP